MIGASSGAVTATQLFETLSERDRNAVKKKGINVPDVLFQLEHLIQQGTSIELERAATLGDGIQVLPLFLNCEKLTEASGLGRLSAFVPASGDATRMFESLYKIFGHLDISEAALVQEAKGGNRHAVEALTTLRNIREFALWIDLEQLGCNPFDWRGILEAMLSPDFLGVGYKAKGLLPFHKYGSIARTAIEDHCYSILDLGFGNIHFTIKEHAVDDVVRAVGMVGNAPRTTRDLAIVASYSFQKHATDTICLSEDGQLHRDSNGDIVFRAGGHGALLTNLMETNGDIVFLRNIDNIVVEKKFSTINIVRRQMGERLLEIEGKIHRALRRLTDCQDASDAIDVVVHDLGLMKPGETRSPDFYYELLDRPIRVCGVIRSKGDVGGGIYWTRDPGGISRVQIVESAQLSYSNEKQREIAEQLAYFNPVDMVCSIRDFRGSPFNLFKFRDDNAVIVTKKSNNGQPILAYEHPGLWNGGMARWNSVFVEIPAETFQPVKRFSDLLSPFHRNDI